MVHKQHAIAGLQFHPESILTTYGRDLLANVVHFLKESEQKERAA
ncbi:MAG: glutamine amidotransferase-related protein [Pseudomonadota bacterium]